MTVEVECATLEEVAEALDAGVTRLLLDNMDARPAARGGASWRRARAELEASGGITLETIRAVAETGVDYISVGRADALGAGAGRQPAAGAGSDARERPGPQPSCAARRACSASLGVSAAKEPYLISAPLR